MYGDSAVTDELQNRLPRASKRNYRRELELEIESIRRAETSNRYEGESSSAFRGLIISIAS